MFQESSKLGAGYYPLGAGSWSYRMGGFGGCLDTQLGDTLSPTMPGGRLLGDAMGHSISGGRGSTSDSERDDLVVRESDNKLKETGSEPSKPVLVVQMASIILYGCQALPVRLKILLDRLLSVLTKEEVMQLLIGFGWTYEDYYKRGYKLQDRSGQILHKWHLMTDQEESLILRQFLHFSETKAIAKQLLNDDTTQENKFKENRTEPRETYQDSSLKSDPKKESLTVESSESLEKRKYDMKEKIKYERSENLSKNEYGLQNNHDNMDYKQEYKQQFSKFTPFNYNLLEHNNRLNSQVKNFFERSNTFLSPLPKSTSSNILQSLPASGHSRIPGVTPSLAGMSGRGNLLRGTTFPSPMLSKSQLSNLLPHSIPPYPYSQIAPKIPHSLSSSASLDPSINHLKSIQAFQNRYNSFNSDSMSKSFSINAVNSHEGSKPSVSNNVNHYANNTLEKNMSTDPNKSSALNLSSTDSISVTDKDSQDNISSGSPIKRSWNSIDNPASFINPLTGKKRVQCSVCLKTFCDKGALKIHFSAVHLREMHKCTVEGCTMMFSSKRSRNRHSANPSPKLHTPHIRRKISPHDGRIAHHALLTPGHPPSSYQALPGYPLGAFAAHFGAHNSLPFTSHGLLGSHSLQQQALNIQNYRMNESADKNYRVSDWHSPMYTEDISTTTNSHDSVLSVDEAEDSINYDRDSVKESNSPSDDSENKRKRKSLKPTKYAFRLEDDNLISTDDDEDDDEDDTDTKDSTEDKELDAISDCDEVPSVDVNQVNEIGTEKLVCDNKTPDNNQSKVSSSSYDDTHSTQNPLQQLEDLSKGNLGHLTSQVSSGDIQSTSSQFSATVNNVTSSSHSHCEFSYEMKNNGESNENEDNSQHTCTVNGCNATFPSKRSCDRHVSNINLHRKLLSTIPDLPPSTGIGSYGTPYNPLLNPELISHLYSNPLNPLLPNILSHFAAMKNVGKADDQSSSGNISPHSTTPNTLGTVNSDILQNRSSPTVQTNSVSSLPEEAKDDKTSHNNESDNTEESVATPMET